MYMLLLGAAVLILVSLFLAGLYVALQRRSGQEVAPQIHNSGVYRLRRSPREAFIAAKPSEKDMEEHLSAQGLSSSEVQSVLQLWREQTELNMRVIEEADLKEVRTFLIEIPPQQKEALARFPAGTYVTRDQLSAHASLIPPFHLGCRAVLKPRNAWETGDWKPLLPAGEGRYDVPDWRTFVR